MCIKSSFEEFLNQFTKDARTVRVVLLPSGFVVLNQCRILLYKVPATRSRRTDLPIIFLVSVKVDKVPSILLIEYLLGAF